MPYGGIAASGLLQGILQGIESRRQEDMALQQKKELLKLEQDKLKLIEREQTLKSSSESAQRDLQERLKREEWQQPMVAGGGIYDPTNQSFNLPPSEQKPVSFDLGGSTQGYTFDPRTGDYKFQLDLKKTASPDKLLETGKGGKGTKENVDRLKTIFDIIAKFGGREDLVAAVIGAKTKEERSAAIAALAELKVPAEFMDIYQSALVDLRNEMGITTTPKPRSGGKTQPLWRKK